MLFFGFWYHVRFLYVNMYNVVLMNQGFKVQVMDLCFLKNLNPGCVHPKFYFPILIQQLQFKVFSHIKYQSNTSVLIFLNVKSMC